MLAAELTSVIIPETHCILIYSASQTSSTSSQFGLSAYSNTEDSVLWAASSWEVAHGLKYGSSHTIQEICQPFIDPNCGKTPVGLSLS